MYISPYRPSTAKDNLKHAENPPPKSLAQKSPHLRQRRAQSRSDVTPAYAILIYISLQAESQRSRHVITQNCTDEIYIYHRTSPNPRHTSCTTVVISRLNNRTSRTHVSKLTYNNIISTSTKNNRVVENRATEKHSRAAKESSSSNTRRQQAPRSAEMRRAATRNERLSYTPRAHGAARGYFARESGCTYIHTSKVGR